MALSPLETLFDTDLGKPLAMPPELAMLYGKLQIPLQAGRTYVISNFVSTLDGVVSLNIPGHSGGSEISGANQQDRMVMGLLRAAADAVVVGAGTLRAVPKHLWTADYIFPDLADAYAAFRALLNKSGSPLNVIVTASGDLDPNLPVFASGKVATLIVTNGKGAERLASHHFQPNVSVQAVAAVGRITAQAVITAINQVRRSELVLVEGGPQLLADFVAEDLLDELFLTLAPQIAGRADANDRPALVEGKLFAPDRAVWSQLCSVKRGDDHLFLRYGIAQRTVQT